MNQKYEPSHNFVFRVMEQVHEYEASRISLVERLLSHPSIRLALAGSGTLFGIFKTVPVF